MDDTDLKILSFLQRDGRKPFTEIAQSLGISEGTVRNRVARMLDERVLRITGMVNPSSLGYDVAAIVGVSLQPAHLDSAATQIATFPEVSYLVMVSGEFDLIIEIVCRNREHLAHFLNEQLGKVSGVLRSQSFIILKTYKEAHGIQPLLDWDTAGPDHGGLPV